MKKYIFKDTDVEFSEIGYGCWRMAIPDQCDPSSAADVKRAQEKIETALSVGMNFIDTADIYTSRWPDGFGEAEALLGGVLGAQSGLRDEMVLATKAGIIPGLPYNSDYEYLISACEASLKRLNVETIDLFQIHRPDLLASFEGVARALSDLKQAGKIKAAGVSNYSVSQFNAVQAHMDFALVSHQNEFSAWRPNSIFDGTLDQCQEKGLIMFAWSPLAAGTLVGVNEQSEPASDEAERQSKLIELLKELAIKYNTSQDIILLAFTLKHPGNVVPIIGTQSIERIRKAADASKIMLDKRDWYDILEARLGHEMP